MMELTAELDRSTVAAGGTRLTGSIRIQPGMTDSDVDRHVALSIDTSGSMSGEKIEQVREGIRWVFGYMADSDYLSIVSFDESVEVILPATQWAEVDLDDAEELVAQLTPGGGTDILEGLEAAYDTLADLAAGPEVGRRILLLSDGRDETPVDRFAAFAHRVRREDGIAIPAAGIGEYYDEETIRTVATASDAEWVHLARAADIENFFGRKVESLRTVVAPTPNLRLELAPGATLDDVYLRQPQVRDANYEERDGAVDVYLPDLLEFETQEVVFGVDSPPCDVGQRFTLLDVTLNTPSETTTTALEVEGVAGTEGLETRVESPEVAVNHVETMVRKAAGDGDVERARTILARATGEEIDERETRVAGGSGVDAEETRIADEHPDVDAEETRIVDDEGSAVGTEETRIAGGDPAAGETVIQADAVPDLSTVIEQETVDELETVVEETDPEDVATQYETTKIEDGGRH